MSIHLSVIPCHTIVAGLYSFTLVSVCPPVRLSILSFLDNNLTMTRINVSRFSTNLVCALILWRSGLGYLMGKFCQFLTELSAHDISAFFFRVDNLSKSQLIFTKLGMCFDIVEIWFETDDYENTPIQIYRKFHLQKLKTSR